MSTGAMLTWSHGSFVLPLLGGGSICILGALVYLFGMGPVEPMVLTR
jgi:hypothetical protein